MKGKSPLLPLFLLGLLFLVLAWFWRERRATTPAGSASNAADARATRLVTTAPPGDPEGGASQPASLADAGGASEIAEKLSHRFTARDTRANEAVLIFKDADGYRRFLARAAQAGVIVAGQIDALNIVRVRVRAYDTFAAELVANAGDYGGISANTFVQIPPEPEERSTGRQVPVGNNLLTTLGVTTDNSTWGRGVTIAVIDGGATPDPTLGGRLHYQDIGLGYAGTGATALHGTAVAALAAGSAADAPGVAPAATILSIRVTGTDEKSDLFTVTQAIVAAVDAGAQIINLSLGGYSNSEALTRAITYADSHGVVLVAAAGNDQASRLTWPAADPRVVSVGAVDATGQQTSFSNSGPQLHLTAPGYGIQTAGANGERRLFSGTSASAPVVSGAIAALLSQTPGLTGAQAVQILQTHADDGGAAGADPDYGSGVLDLGWAMARNDPARADTAVSSFYYNANTASMEVVLQNRGNQPVANLTLALELNGRALTSTVALLNAGQVATVTIPLDATQLASRLTLRARLTNPGGFPDVNPANNSRATVIDFGVK